MSERFDMTGYQRAIYGIEKTYPGTGVCNIGGMISLAPGTDEGALIAAVKCAILHIPAMRLRLSSDGKLYVSDEVQETEVSEFDGDHEKKAQEIISEPFELYDRPLDMGTGEELEGATIQIIDKDGNVVETWVSSDEVHTIEGLTVGEEYTLRETVAPEDTPSRRTPPSRSTRPAK